MSKKSGKKWAYQERPKRKEAPFCASCLQEIFPQEDQGIVCVQSNLEEERAWFAHVECLERLKEMSGVEKLPGFQKVDERSYILDLGQFFASEYSRQQYNVVYFLGFCSPELTHEIFMWRRHVKKE